jgi:NAD(P)-dependent dehydrogenase (short-subunit alcohol dehydrogenase family)
MTTLVIGGTSGIGQAVAERLSRKGLSGTILTPSVAECDVTDSLSIDRFFSERGPFSRIVYSAGENFLCPLGWIDTDDMEDTFDVNVMGFIRVLDAVVRNRKSTSPKDTGRYEWDPVSVVAVVSDSATTAMRHSITYASSKAALAHAIRCGARELAPWCRVNGVSPSIVEDTPMTAAVDVRVQKLRGWTAEEARDYEMSLVPMGRRCTKNEVAKVVCQVLDGPEFMTGSIIPITGGK